MPLTCPFSAVPHTHRIKLLAASCAVALIGTGSVAHAQDGDYVTPGMSFELGAGGSVSPSYEGSSRYMISPYPIIRFNYIKFNNGFQLGGGSEQGFSFKPSFNYRGERSAKDDPALAGLSTVDASIELGAGVAYRYDMFEVYGNLRYGVSGHEGWTGEVGARLHMQPIERLDLAIGPNFSFADDQYMDAYFSVTPAEAAASTFAAYNASSGIKTVGIEAEARYALTENWSAEGTVRYDRLIGDAADSPVTAVGDKNQWGFKLGLSRKFRIDF